MIFQHPLAYLAGLEGVALLRAFAGEHDEAFTRARLAELRDLLAEPDRWGPGVGVHTLTTRASCDGEVSDTTGFLGAGSLVAGTK